MPGKHTNVLAVKTAVHISRVSLNSRFAGEIRCFVVCLDVLCTSLMASLAFLLWN